MITSGPYRLVRHPLYAGMFVVFFFTSLALGSYVALLVIALLVPVFVLRALNEEKVLCAELPDYTEYCQKTRWRIVPMVW